MRTLYATINMYMEYQKNVNKVTMQTTETQDYISHDNPSLVDDVTSPDQLTEQYLHSDERPQRGEHDMQSHRVTELHHKLNRGALHRNTSLFITQQLQSRSNEYIHTDNPSRLV